MAEGTAVGCVVGGKGGKKWDSGKRIIKTIPFRKHDVAATSVLPQGRVHIQRRMMQKDKNLRVYRLTPRNP